MPTVRNANGDLNLRLDGATRRGLGGVALQFMEQVGGCLARGVDLGIGAGRTLGAVVEGLADEDIFVAMVRLQGVLRPAGALVVAFPDEFIANRHRLVG